MIRPNIGNVLFLVIGLSLFTLQTSIGFGEEDDYHRLPLSFWQHLYDNEHYQPLTTLAYSLNENHKNWEQKALLSSFAFWYNGDYEKASVFLHDFLNNSSLDTDTRLNYHRMLEGWYLIQKDLDAYRNYRLAVVEANSFNDPGFYLNESIYGVFSRNVDHATAAMSNLRTMRKDTEPVRNDILKLENQLLSIESPKSPLLGSLLSGIIPGSGAIYAGRIQDGLYSFFLVSGFALLTGESVVNNGWSHPSTLALGAIGISFYIGNVYGGYRRSVEYNESFYHELDHTSYHLLHQFYSPD